MAIFNLWQQSPAAALKLHPQTTQVVLQQGTGLRNLLVGYLSVTITKPTSIKALTVSLTGTQELDWRQGQGPSSTEHTIRHRCIDLSHTLISSEDHNQEWHALVDMARVGGSNHAVAGERGMLTPGEYRFAFEFALPSGLPASVDSPLGGVRYTLMAGMRRSWVQMVVAEPVCISMVQAPKAERDLPALVGFPSLTALAMTSLVMEAKVGNGWKISVYAVSRVLALGVPTKLQAYVTRIDDDHNDQGDQRSGGLEVVELGIALSEIITYRISPNCTHKTRAVVARASSDSVNLLAIGKSFDEQQQWMDAQTIESLGESLDELSMPSVAQVQLALGKGVQASSGSAVFSVAHELSVNVCVRSAEGEVARVTLASHVVVLPEALSGIAGAGVGVSSSLPCYAQISDDVVLASSDVKCSIVAGNYVCAYPPPYQLSEEAASTV
ncbi:hypothetical protein LPJ66_000147 [Kickxella alabastrina]|uniref:Uncharacterized protein n=1 Tax=Kickxella alabastrina TaxID=61397 RepID=A0ACC1IWZ5_9FUNG|nr:hypothetical protein LPJ66_000147 [Kickxella alabastrina]